MIRKDEFGNLYTLSDNSGYFIIKNLPKVKGNLDVVFCGDSEIKREFKLDGQDSVMIKLSSDDVESLGVGKHRWYGDLTFGKEKDTVIYKTISVFEKEM